MSLKPWREIAKPHRDVLEGSFKQSEFAADITQVAQGEASADYQDAEKFFARTFITEGMKLLLISVAERLSGRGGDPVIQLQTAFGGGKTHTMLAVYHLASRKVSTECLSGIPSLLDEAHIDALPQARVAVIDGNKFSPSQATQKGKQKIQTLWGELAWQLLGESGFSLLAESDQNGVSPGKEILIELLTKAAPCVILMDELVAFIRQFEMGKSYRAGTFDSNISFIQAITEALKSVPNAVLLASLPESDLEVGGSMGQRALNALEKYFARVEAVWKPVASEESFEIVRRRLFETAGDSESIDSICKKFADFYKRHHNKFPVETQSHSYFERLRHSYPIHPEVFDRLYDDWSTLDKFQRTRGVLQYMAIVIHKLWNSDNRDALILPGSIPLEDPHVRNKSIHYLPQGWEPVIEREVDGSRSTAQAIDAKNTLFGGVQAARRTARTIFLGSAPSTSKQMVRGIKVERILLGAVQPEQTLGHFEDVLKSLRDRLHHLYSDQDRFWLDTQPNLRREMESRKQNVDDSREIQPLMKRHLLKLLRGHHNFSGIHIFMPSSDIPDEYGSGVRLVILPATAAYSKTDRQQSIRAAEEILKNRGTQPRQKQNRLIFLAPDYDVMGRLFDQARTYCAWTSIVEDMDQGSLNLDLYQAKQARKYCEGAEQNLSQFVREAFKCLLAPFEEMRRGKMVLDWESVSIEPSASNMLREIETKLKEEEWVIDEWSPIHLKKLLKQWYFKNEVKEVSALKVWQDCCHYLYLPRLVKDQIYKNTIALGVEKESFFAYALGKEDSHYLGFVYKASCIVNLDGSSLLIECNAAESYQRTLREEKLREEELEQRRREEERKSAGLEATEESRERNIPEPPPDSIEKSETTHFYGTVELNSVNAKVEFRDIINEVTKNFTLDPNVNLTISIDIQASTSKGFSESLQRTIKENCTSLNFQSAEFEE